MKSHCLHIRGVCGRVDVAVPPEKSTVSAETGQAEALGLRQLQPWILSPGNVISSEEFLGRAGVEWASEGAEGQQLFVGQ